VTESDIDRAKEDGRRAVEVTEQGIASFLEASRNYEASDESLASLKVADEQISRGVSELVRASIELEPAMMERTSPELQPALQERLLRARHERDGDYLLQIVTTFSAGNDLPRAEQAIASSSRDPEMADS
jgi:hypothetical protein